MTPSLLRRTVAWAVTGCCAFAVFGVIDALLVLRHGGGLRFAAASGGAAMALGVVVSAIAAMPAAALEFACSTIARSPSPARRLWIGLVGLVALAAAGAITLAPLRKPDWTLVALFVFAGGVVASAALSRWRRRGWACALSLALVAGALALDVWFDPLNSDLHDMLGILEVCGVLAAMTGLRARVRQVGGRTLALWAAGLGVFAVAAIVAAEPIAPGWRVRSVRYGRMQPRLGRTCRAFFDFDGDGFSSLFWGGDCDDRDARRNPRAPERANGIDANCNGTVLPAHPTDADVGLAAPAGDPNLPAGAIDRVILLTIDCLRADAFTDSTMPNLARIARGGVRMRRMYAAATSTAGSVPFIERVKAADPTVAALLGPLGIESTAVFSVPIQIAGLADGYSRVLVPEGHEQRWSADQVTAEVLSALHAEAPPRFVWAHYMDMHQPIGSTGWIAYGPPIVQPGVTPEYRGAAARVDAAIDELVRALEPGGRLERTVLVVTADHGESFGAHGVDYHALDAYEELVHVPGVVVAPGLKPGEYDEVVTHRDLPPTILGAFGQVKEGGGERFGRSWMRLRAAPGRPLHRFVVSYSTAMRVGNARRVEMAAVIERRYKLAETFENNLTEMFDLEADPGEEDDLAPLRSTEFARLHRELALFRDVDGFR